MKRIIPKISPDREAQLLVNAVISGQKHLFDLEQLKFTRYYDKETKNRINLCLKHLLKREKVFESFQAVMEKEADKVHDVYFDFMEEVQKIEISDMENAQMVLEAFRTDRDKMEKAVNDILIK